MKLGVKVQTVSNWRTRGSQAEAATIDAMCRQLEEDPTPWLLRIQAEQGGEDSANSMVWRRVATRLGVSLSMLSIAFGGLAVAGASHVASLSDSSSTAFSFVLSTLRMVSMAG